MSGIRDALEQATGQDTAEFDALTEGVEPEPESGPPAAPGSVLAAIRARAHDISAEQTIDLELPWYSGKLWGRYKAIPMRLVYRAKRNGEVANPLMEPDVAADALAHALVELLGAGPDGELEPLSQDAPMRFDDQLVEALQLEPRERSARGVIYALFAHSGRAEGIVLRHFTEYYTWLSGEDSGSAEIADLAAGESLAR
jgi:hypothetical protein